MIVVNYIDGMYGGVVMEVKLVNILLSIFFF